MKVFSCWGKENEAEGDLRSGKLEEEQGKVAGVGSRALFPSMLQFPQSSQLFVKVLAQSMSGS